MGASSPPVPARRRRPLPIDISRLGDSAPTVAAVLLVLVVGVVAVPSFYGGGNLQALAPQFAALGLVTMGQTLVLLVRGFDLSVSAIIPGTAVLLTQTSLGSVPVRVLIVFGLALTVGLANGLLVTKRHVPPFIATFGMLIFLEGARLAYTQAQTSGTAPSWMAWFGSPNRQIWGVPRAVFILGALALLFAWILKATPYGRWIHAVGSNPNAARYSGIRTDSVTISCYVLCSLLAAFAALIYGGFVGYIDTTLGSDANLNSIAAAVIGGVAFVGGRGTILGALAGVFVIVGVLNLLTLSGLAIEWRYLMQGALLVGAVSLQGVRTRRLTRLA